MHSAALMQHVVRPPSPASEGSDEEKSLDTARVYFGPFQTPEKRFTAIVAIPDPEPAKLHSSQDVGFRERNRSDSPSSSSSAASNEILDVEKLLGIRKSEHDDKETDMVTPQASGIPDDNEPSSALANKLLCAPGNPSPPPSPMLLPMLDDDDTDEASTDRDGECLAITPAAPTSPTLEPVRQAVSPTPGSSTAEEPDLMSFHSFDDRLDFVTSIPSGQENARQAPPSPFSFPDAITSSSTATPQVIESFQGRTEVLIDIQDEPSCVFIPVPSPQNDKIVEGKANSPETDMQNVLAPEPSISHPRISNDDSFEKTAVRNVHDSPHTPLRRSSRPRKSSTPHVLKYAASADVDEDQTLSPARTTRPDAQTRKTKKGKERTPSPSKFKEDSGTLEVISQSGPLISSERSSDVKTQRRKSSSPIRRVFTRELGSLSPNSAELLSSLVPGTEQVESESGVSTGDLSGAVISNTKPDDSVGPSRQSSEPAPTATSSDKFKDANKGSSPMRIPATPRKPHILTSPFQVRFNTTSLDDPARTPARRVPIEQAVAEGHVSPQKLLRMQSGSLAPVSMFTGHVMPVLNMSLKGDSSPARRIVGAPSISGERGSHKASLEKMRQSESPDKQVTVVPMLQKRVKISQSTKLPFPFIVESQQATSKGKTEKSDDLSQSANQSKSSLKQTSSRIPRKKPYSRPLVASTAKDSRKSDSKKSTSKNPAGSSTLKPAVVKSGSTTNVPNDVSATSGKRVIRAVDLSKSSNKQIGPAPNSPLCDAIPPSADTRTNANRASTVGILKRKRVDSKSMTHNDSRSLASRQRVTTATPSSSSSTVRSTAATSMRSSKSVSNAKPTVMKIRRVMPPNPSKPSQPPASQAASKSLTSETPIHESLLESNSSHPVTMNQEQATEAREEVPLPPNEDMVLSSPITGRLDSPEVFSPTANSRSPSPLQPLQSSSPQSLVFLIDPLSPISSSNALPAEYSNEYALTTNGRRRTRLSNSAPIQPDTDALRNHSSTTYNNARPSHRRRTSSAATSRVDDVFSGMSMTALKNITANNTAKNQQYVAASLETEIIRKNGFRPESPAVKIKTIVQRQQEEKVKQREERAARRARRQGKPDSDGEQERDSENASPTPEPSDALIDAPVRHTRGAGDDEDYETPLKPMDGGKRRVKWDKGLFTQVFLDDIVPGMKAVLKENITTKGCLTPGAKRLQLDTLGNVTEPENPLSDFTRENVVVKKFVYDDDVEAAPPPSAIPVPRNTRSRAKKGKG